MSSNIYTTIIKKEDLRMSLITCPKCGEAISEKATVCPYCKFNLSQQNLIMCGELRNRVCNKIVGLP